MTVTNNPKNSGSPFTLDMGQDSATGNQVQKVVVAEPAGGTFITPALETGGNLASIKTNTSTTSAGTAATAGLPVQGMTGGVPVPMSVTSLPLPTGAAQDGTDGTGITPPTGAVGIRGWLSGIFNKLNTSIGVTGTFWQTTQPVSAASLPLPTGAATSANQPTAAAQGSPTSGQTGRLVEGAVTTSAPAYTTGQTSPLSLDTTGNLRVSVISGGASGNVAQGSTTASNTGPMTQGAVTTSAPTYTTGQTDPLSLNTSGGLRVDGSGVTQPVSAASLPLPTGASTSANQPTAAAQGSPTSGQTGHLTEGAVTTSAPTYTTGQTNPLSLDTAGNLRVTVTSGGASGNVAQGSTSSGNTGPMIQGAVTTAAPTYTTTQTEPLSLTTSGALRIDGSGVTQPVSLASQPLPTGASTAAKQPALGTAGTASADVITVQGVASMTPVKTDGSGVTQPISAASLPLPAGAATAVGLTAVVTALGTPMQTTGGSVTANAGTNLNTSALALETGGNLASIKTNTAITAAGTTATSGSPVQGMTGGVPVPVSVASLPLPSGAAADGTDGTGIVQPTGGVGIRGWLSGIYSKLVSPVLPANAAQETGGNLAAILTAATGSIPAGASIIGKVGIDQTTPGTTNAVVASAGTNLNTSALALESGGNLATLLATRTVTPASTNSVTTSAAAIAAHISAVAGQYGYLARITISGLGATATSAINCNIQGLIGGTRQFWIQIPAGVNVALNPIQLAWNPAVQSSAVNTIIQVNVPSFGAGNVEASVVMDGYTSASPYPM